MLAVIKNINVPCVILRHILIKYLDVVSIKIIILNVKEMNVLDEFSKEILLNAKKGLNWNCQNGHLSVVQYLVELGNSHRLSPNSTYRYADKLSVGDDIYADDNAAVRQASRFGHLSTVQYLVELRNSH